MGFGEQSKQTQQALKRRKRRKRPGRGRGPDRTRPNTWATRAARPTKSAIRRQKGWGRVTQPGACDDGGAHDRESCAHDQSGSNFWRCSRITPRGGVKFCTAITYLYSVSFNFPLGAQPELATGRA
eukprot:1009717-Prymnesium_polylepis.1